MTIDDIIAEGRRLEAKATPGPWTENNAGGVCDVENYLIAECFADDCDEKREDIKNSAFIAFARNHFLDLITALEQARAALAEREREVEELKERISAALAITPTERNPISDTQKLFNLIAGMLRE